MASGCGTIMMICFLALASGLDLHHTHPKDSIIFGQTPVLATDELEGEPRVNTADRSFTSQTVQSKQDNNKVDKSRHFKHKDGASITDTDRQNVQNTLKKGDIANQDLSLSPRIIINHFDQSKINSEHDGPTVLLYQRIRSEEANTKTQMPHNSHPEYHVLEDNEAELSDHLASGLSQVTDVKSFQRSSKEMKLSCCKISSSTANCTGCGLTCVPTDLPRNITRLHLTDNYISSDDLYAGVFVNYTQLVELWLDSNNITFLPEGVFDGLEHLRFLSLYNNSITLNMELNNSTVFYPLRNTLETLILSKNTKDTYKQYLVYPDVALSVLKNLSRLHIDGLKQRDFGIGFSNLTKLTHLSLNGFFDGYCNMTSISNHTFSYLQHVTFLSLSDCHLNGALIESNAFSNLYKLQFLDVSYNFDLGIHAVGKFMYGLQNNIHFIKLKMECIIRRYTPCVVIYKHTLRHFKNSSLRAIDAMNNEIEMIELGALDMLPSTLEMLNLTGNRIMFGAYWKDMASLTGLKQLHLDGYLHAQGFPHFLPSDNLQCPDKTEITINNIQQQNGGEKCICGNGTCSSDKKELILPLPPNLEVFTMHSKSLVYTVNNIIRFCPANNLTSVDLSGNTFKHLEGSITGLKHIRDLNLSSSFIETIGDYFFDNLTSLENLNLFQNLLGDYLNNDVDGKIFDKLNSMKTLNLSFNNMYRLNELAFKDLDNLEILDLSTNRISNVNFSIKHMTNLLFIDFHKNSIANLPTNITDAIDVLLQTRKVSIDLSNNPIYCDCSNLDFLEWVVRSKVLVGNFTNYYCKYRNGKKSTAMKHGYGDEMNRLRRECSTHWILLLYVIGGTLLLIVFTVGLLLYRFRWTLRYWFHAAKMKIYSSPHQANEEYEFDVFVSYASEDVNFVLQELSPHLSGERHLKLMIHGEKFQAGRHITDNIYMAVRQCRKTLVLVTRQMLASHWCGYELQMARTESITRGRDVLVFLFLEEIPTNLMNVDVMSYIKTSTYIFYPTDVQHREAFWNKLADDLRAQ